MGKHYIYSYCTVCLFYLLPSSGYLLVSYHPFCHSSSEVLGLKGRFYSLYAEKKNNLYFPIEFMILVKLLELIFPSTGDMDYTISDLSIVTSVGDVNVQGPHTDTEIDAQNRQNFSFLYSLTDSTSLIFWDDVGNNTLHPTRVRVPRGSVLVFGGNSIHSGSDQKTSTHHYRLHGYIDNLHVHHASQGFGNIDFSAYNIRYDAVHPYVEIH